MTRAVEVEVEGDGAGGLSWRTELPWRIAWGDEMGRYALCLVERSDDPIDCPIGTCPDSVDWVLY